MALPEPADGELQDDFMARCLADDAMAAEYPDEATRLNACAIAWMDGNDPMASASLAVTRAPSAARSTAVQIRRPGQTAKAADLRCAPARDLPVKDGTWDGGAAAKRMLDAAGIGGDNPDTGKARRGFLIYDASAPELRGSYHLPFADIVDGTLTAIGNGLRNAASRLPQTSGVGPDLQAKAKDVISAYLDKLNGKSAPQAVSKTFAAPAPGDDPLEYIMSDGSIDRIGDIIEPRGWQLEEFKKNPIALFNHNPNFPIGMWKDVRVENGQLRGRLFLPPPESERQRELQGFVKAGVLRAVSVGFSADDVEPIKDSKKGGFRFLKQSLLECSLVGIPANPNALQVAKSLGASDETQRLVFSVASDITRKAAVSTPRQQRSRSYVSLKETTTMARKSLAEQISALENARAAKAARMEEIQQKAADEDRTKDDAEREEFNTLDIEIDSIDKELQDLRKLERAMMSTAKAAIGHNSQAAGESREPVRGQHVTFMQRQLPPGIPFARFVRCCVAAKGIPISALQIAEKQYPDMDDLHTVLRAAVSAGNTHADAFGANLIAYQVMASEFIEYLRPMTVIGRIPGLRRVPFNVRIPRQTAGASAYWVGEGQPKPVTNLAFDYILLRWTKLANIAVLTDEVIRFSNPAIDTLVRDDLAAAIVQQQDTDFLDPSNSGSTDVKPASITNGVTPVASSGATADDARADAVAVMNKFAAANIPAGGLVWVMNETTAMVLSAMLTALGVPYFPGITASGGTWMGFPVVTSQVAAAAGSPLVSNIVLLRPQDIFLADDGQVQIDVSNEASLQMLDNPTNASASGSPSAPTATSLVSLWQTNSTAVRAERFINWQKARAASVQYISGEAYAV